jgi:hypothetical protein
MMEFWSSLEAWPLSAHIAETWWFPLLESIHVLTAAFVVGSILMIDLRLLGVAARRQSVMLMLEEMVPWTWGAFVIASIAGLGLFITRASVYVENPAMQIKLLLLVLAGINMAVLHFVTLKGVGRWDVAASPPTAAKIAGASSLLLWIGVTLAGRWIGHLS